VWRFGTWGGVLLLSAAACHVQPHAPSAETEGDETGEPEQSCAVVSPPRLVRMTHAQYDNTVRDLLGMSGTPSEEFLADPEFSGFDNNAEGLTVPDRLARDYRRAAEELAGQVVHNEDALKGLLDCAPTQGDRDCASTLVSQLGQRAYRRPLEDSERDSYLALYDSADGGYENGSPFEQGVRLVIETMLQSPNFLYRVELSSELDGDDLIPLGAYEIASRLSYLLWNSTPDAALLEAAADGELDDAAGIEAHARRLLDDERAAGSIEDFHRQWLRVSEYADLTKEPALAEGTSEAMQEETRRFVEHVVLELEGDYATLMTADFSFVNDQLAEFYGLDEPVGSTHEKVSLDPTRRAGLLTQSGFLAAHAYPDLSSPIHRGVFVQRQVLCADLPDPPPGIDASLPEPGPGAKTTRQRVEQKTAPEACAGCHALINGPGFAFEHYDQVGSWRTKDNGEPIDSKAALYAPGGTIEFDDAVDMVHQLADHPDAKRCYLTQWYRYGYARHETPADQCTIDALYETVDADGFGVKELLVSLTQTRSFRFRSADECG
jgi:hypothetical protein